MREPLSRYLETIRARTPEYPHILLRRVAQLVQQIKIEEDAKLPQKYGMNPWILRRFRCVWKEEILPENRELTEYSAQICEIEIEY